MRIIKKIFYFFLKKISYIRYARRIGVNIGEDCRLIGSPNFGTEPYLISIGNHVSVSGGCTFLTHEGAHWVLKGLDSRYNSTFGYGKIIVKDNVYIGYGVTLLRGVTIGENTIVGACSLVNKSLDPNSVYAGVPCKKVCTLDEWKKKFLEDQPLYDSARYKKNKKEVVLEIVDSFKSR